MADGTNSDFPDSYRHPDPIGEDQARRFARICIRHSVPFALFPVRNEWIVLGPPRAKADIIQAVTDSTEE